MNWSKNVQKQKISENIYGIARKMAMIKIKNEKMLKHKKKQMSKVSKSF